MQVCGICGDNHCPMDCDIVQVDSHIPDKMIPSKAKLTVPEDLELRKVADNTYTVVALYTIEKGTQFGPLQAQKLCSLLPTINFPLKVFYKNEDNFSEYYLDTSNENECNWMMFVNSASDFKEQNAICYQDGEDIYYVTIKDIYEGEALKVWYSPYYASKMQKDILKPDISNDIQSNKNIDLMVQNKKNITLREMWSCKFCGKMEKNLLEFALHLLQHYREKSAKYCSICNVSFLRLEGYQKHMKIVHATDVAIKTTGTLDQKLSIAYKPDKTLDECVSKDNYFGGPLLLNELLNDSFDNTTLAFHPNTDLNHMDLTGIENQNILFESESLNLNAESVLPENEKDLDNFNFDIVPDETEQLVCDICLKTFKNLKAILMHMNVHTGTFACFYCNKVFARKENFKYHSCTTFYKLKCTHCDRLFSQPKYFTFHMKNAHGHKCKKCKQNFESEENLKSHQCSINIEKARHPCTQCSKVFTHKNNLIIHMRCHNRQEQRYNCPICNAELKTYKTYLKHRKLHEGHTYKCDVCQKVFNRSDTLKSHKDNVHSTEKLETCEICQKSFKSKILLKTHREVHQDNVFTCQQCFATFKQRRNLSRHIKICQKQNSNSQSFLSNDDKQFSCPKCNKKLKSSTSVRRHLKSAHPDCALDRNAVRIKKTIQNKQINLSKQVEDLKETIENMNYNTDVINHDHEITLEIDKYLNNPEAFTSDSNDRLVESLINRAVSENNLEDKTEPKDPMLSMPDLDIDHISLLSNLKR